MDCPFAIEDVFAAGVGCDIAGAWYVARGLNASPDQIKFAGVSLLGGNSELWARGVSDRVDGRFGVFWLVVGFSLQLLGYGLSVATESSASASGLRGAVAVAFGIAAFALIWLLQKATYLKRLRGVSVNVAHIAFTAGGYKTMPAPSAEMLSILGQRIRNEPMLADESHEQYARRVWRVDRVSDHGAFQ